MKPILLQYSTPVALLNKANFYGGLIITAQKQMANTLAINKFRALDINSFLRALLPQWYSPLRLMRQRLLLRRVIEECTLHQSDEVKNAFLNNTSDLLKSIRTLIEVGATTESLPKTNLEQEVFRSIFASFVQSNESGVTLLYDSLVKWNDPAQFIEVLNHCRLTKGKPTIGCPRAIYFQGFYYVHPMQSRLMDAFIALSIPFYFVNANDEKFPLDYEVWKKNPRFQNGYETRLINDGASTTLSFSEPKCLKFTDVFALVRYLRQIDEKTHPMAPMSDDIKELLETFFPKENEKESLVAYPAGRYLWGLYDMWDEPSQNLILDPDNVKQCLSTGWAGPQYKGNHEGMQIYMKVAHYFSDCSTIKEWEARLKNLEFVVTKVIPVFNSQKSSCISDRWQTLVNSPFATIGAFNASIEEVQEVVETLHQMINDARTLFATEKGEIQLVDHFKRVKLLLQRKVDKAEIQDEEKQIIDKINERLSWDTVDVPDCKPSQLTDAMQFFLGGSFDEVIEEDDSLLGGVSGLADVEALVLRYANEALHVCCCDANTLPGKPKSFSWPTSREYFDQLHLDPSSVARRDDYLYYMQSTGLSNRYLFHVACQHTNLTLSWIAKQKDKDINPSVYLRLRFDDLDSLIPINGLLLNEVSSNAVPTPIDLKELQIKLNNHFMKYVEIPMEVNRDYEVCPGKIWRALYDFGLDRHPYYTSEFHIQFVLTMLICLVKESIGCSVEDAAKQVFRIYPAFSASEQQEILNWAKFNVNKLVTGVGEQSMDCGTTKRRLYLNYLNQKIAESLIAGNKSDFKDVCIFCPHKGYCIATRYEEI